MRAALQGSIAALAAAAIVTGCRASPPPVATPGPASDTRWVEGGAGRLRVTDRGAGSPAIVFLHGLGNDRTVWDAQLEHLRARYRVVAYDQRGHGDSAAAPAGDYTLAALADDLEAVRRQLGLGPMVLVGHSMSGAVITTYAGRHPDAVAGLVYVDAIGDLAVLPPADVAPVVAAANAVVDAPGRQAFFRAELARAQPATRARVDAGLARMDGAAFGAMFTALGALRDGRARLAPYHGPAVAIEDATNHSPDLASASLGVRRVELAGVSHWLHLDDPDGFARALDAFLATLPTTAPPR